VALHFRDAFLDLQASRADTVFVGSDHSDPIATIAITVYKRFEYLREAVQSALAQDIRQPFEVIVVDDDPDSTFAEQLLEQLPALRNCNFRYIINRDNLGVNGTFNRAIEAARGEWVSILNDDDLLDRDFLSTMVQELSKDPKIDGIASRKRRLDERVSLKVPSRSLPRSIAAALLRGALFAGRSSRPITARKMFWWPLIGNCAGLIFRRDAALALGGFYSEEGPAGDWLFFTRFGLRYNLRQHRAVAASVRIAKNESAKVSVLQSFLMMSYKLQQALTAEGAPPSWRRFTPMIIARQRAYYRDFWHIDAPDSEVEKWVPVRLPPDRPIRFRILRLINRGF
jgi:glycosyltransferase involved in cell wall biosynthesis